MCLTRSTHVVTMISVAMIKLSPIDWSCTLGIGQWLMSKFSAKVDMVQFQQYGTLPANVFLQSYATGWHSMLKCLQCCCHLYLCSIHMDCCSYVACFKWWDHIAFKNLATHNVLCWSHLTLPSQCNIMAIGYELPCLINTDECSHVAPRHS